MDTGPRERFPDRNRFRHRNEERELIAVRVRPGPAYAGPQTAGHGRHGPERRFRRERLLPGGGEREPAAAGQEESACRRGARLRPGPAASGAARPPAYRPEAWPARYCKRRCRIPARAGSAPAAGTLRKKTAARPETAAIWTDETAWHLFCSVLSLSPHSGIST